MTTYTTIADANLDPDSPARSIDALALRDNPIAIAEGAAGAPRIEDAALDSTATAAGSDWVLGRTALATLSLVGTYAFLQNVSGSTLSAGQTEPGASLVYSGTGAASASSPPGTWRTMGNAPNTESTLFLRIS